VNFAFFIVGVFALGLSHFSSRKFLPFWSLLSVLSFLGLLVAGLQAIQFFLTSLLAASGFSFFLLLVWSFDHPLLIDIRNFIGRWFNRCFNLWIALPTSFHRHIVISYSAFLTLLSLPNGVSTKK